jgi:class 3 adenylate cyclase
MRPNPFVTSLRTLWRHFTGKPQLIYRLLGYAGLLALAVLLLEIEPSAAGILLLLWAGVWPLAWYRLSARFPALRDAHSRGASLAHSVECLLPVVLLFAAGAPAWLLLAVSLLGLSGVTALGGAIMLLPCAVGLGTFLVLALPGQALAAFTDGLTIAGGLLLLSCLLGLAWQAHRQARALNAGRRAALSRSSSLEDQIARLSRYLPSALRSEPLKPQAPKEVFLTVAFLDLVGFAELVQRHSVAEVIDVLNDFMAAVSKLTGQHGGELGKFLGDGVLVYFGAAQTSARVKAAAACLRLARDLGSELDALSRDWRSRGLGLRLNVRVGVASGYCALGDWGGQARLDYTLIGTPVNLASRLQALAGPGSILVSSATAALLAQAAELGGHLGPPRGVELKGLGPVVVHEISASAKVRAIPLPVRSGKPDV